MLLAEASAALISRSGVFAACAACYLLILVCSMLLAHTGVQRATCCAAFTCSCACAACYLIMRVCCVLLDHAGGDAGDSPGPPGSAGSAGERRGAPGSAGNAGERRGAPGTPGSAGERRVCRVSAGSFQRRFGREMVDYFKI